MQLETLGALTQNLMFPGQYEDLDTEGAGVTLSHNWHRTYDPTLGRYLQSDPIGLAGGLNRYAYVGGNPMNAVDPEGLDGTLTIYAKDGDGGFGHSFIQFCPTLPDPDGKTECETRGMWPTDNTALNPFDDTERGPRTEDDGLDNPSNPNYKHLSTRIGDRGEQVYRKRVKTWENRGYSLFGSACTHFSLDIWNASSGRPIFPLTYRPSSFVKEIDKQNGRP